ncbi:colicin-like pore-forming protein [Pseudomonas aeruginosa]|nr:colicin-like pore-forming protein [Pseudomonas aeruginosa]MDF5986921.1 colicin-like pore-forming protein [Pseudomonas aeruginosa]MDF5991750.1 colicin-like pore-forming protein [Pseudomonas aeruginosa]MDF5995171.1 colicin-like pore-forming protein [Pseudomonas aeruginosa]
MDEIASLQTRLDKLNAETTRRRTEAERKAAEEQALQDAVKFTADFYKEVTEKFGARTSEMAHQLAEGARGKISGVRRKQSIRLKNTRMR